MHSLQPLVMMRVMAMINQSINQSFLDDDDDDDDNDVDDNHDAFILQPRIIYPQFCSQQFKQTCLASS